MFSIAELYKNKKYLNIYSIFLLTFLFHVPLIFQGLDVTDEGYHLTHQVSSFASSVDVDHVSLMYFFSDFAGGFWLSLIGKPSLLWARIGGLLLISINSLIIFSILSSCFQRRKAFAAVLVTSIFITMRSGYMIDYYSFPAFLLCLQLWLFNQIIRHSGDGRKMRLCALLLGFLTVPIVLSRLSLLLLILLPAALLAYYKFSNNDISRAIYVSKMASMGAAFSAILFGALYWHLGILSSLDVVFNNIWSSVLGRTESHNMTNLIELYLRCYGEILVGSILIVLGFLALVRFMELLRINDIYRRLVPISITILGLIMLAIVDLNSGLAHIIAYPLLSVFIGLILIFIIFYFKFNRNLHMQLDLLLIAGAIIMILTPIGSNTGVYKSSYGMWLILPLSLLCLDRIWENIDFIRANFRRPFLKNALALMLVLAIFFQFSNIYRDNPNRFELDSAFSDPSLFGIYSTPERVEVVDELLVQIKKHSEKDDEILIIGTAPLFYYLTETRAAMGNPWLFLLSLEMIQSKQEGLKEERRYPELTIVCKVETENGTWPDNRIAESGPQALKYNYLVREYLHKLNYTFLWENEAFAIYKIPSHVSFFI